MYSKYRAKKTVVDGITFDSKKEAGRYLTLKALEATGTIKNLQRQVQYTLIPKQASEGKLERPVTYRADFVYTDEDGKTVVEDVKGVRTREYIIKRKLMLYIHHIAIKEI